MADARRGELDLASTWACLVRDPACSSLVDMLIDAHPQLAQQALVAALTPVHTPAYERLVAKGLRVGDEAIDALLRPFEAHDGFSTTVRAYHATVSLPR